MENLQQNQKGIVKMALYWDFGGIIMMEIEVEDIYFMCKINYSDIAEKYIEVIKYCLRFSDSFSVITNLEKPYSKNPLIFKHALLDWNECLIKQVVGIKKWAGTETKDTHKVMNIYNLRSFRTTIKDLPNLFLPFKYNLPEDVCFYRDNVAWFVTISHEKMSFVYNPTKEDIEFFIQTGIRFN